MVQAILYSVRDSGILRDKENHFDSDFENEVWDDLKKEGLIIETQIEVFGYKIDLGVYDTESSKYILV